MGFWRWFFRVCPSYEEIGNARVFCIRPKEHDKEHLGRYNWRHYHWK